MNTLKVQLLTATAKAPTKATAGSIGYDIYSDATVILAAHTTALISTGIKVKAPRGTEFQIRSRSGLALKGLIVLNAPGTIDHDYDAELGIILHNTTDDDFLITTGDRIAQGVIAPVHNLAVEIVEDVAIERTTRVGGFGSTNRTKRVYDSSYFESLPGSDWRSRVNPKDNLVSYFTQLSE